MATEKVSRATFSENLSNCWGSLQCYRPFIHMNLTT